MCRRLVGDELIACGQVEGPVTSVYRWRNEVHEVTEWRARLKTVPAAVHEVTHRLYEDHPDELPEITVLPYIGGLTPYVEWVEQSVDAVPDSDWAQG
jgi:periplasmic divalent cation tolerance protein